MMLCLLSLLAPARAQEGTPFPVRKVQVEGNTVLSPQLLQQAVGSYEGRSLTLPDLQQLAADLRAEYEKQGYFLVRVQVPTQTLQDGVVRLQVTEGRVGQLRIEGNENYSTEYLRGYFEDLLAETPARLETLHRALLLLNDHLHLKAESFIEPGKDPGTADVVVKVEDSLPLEVTLAYDNFGNQFTGTNRFTVAPHAGNLFGHGESLYVATVVPFPSVETHPYVLAAFDAPVDRDGTRVGFSYANGAFTVGGNLATLDIRGQASLYSVFVNRALERQDHHRSDLLGAFNVKTYDNSILGFPTSHDEIRSLSLGYRAEWNDDVSRDLMATSVTQGLGTMLGGTSNSSGTSSRPGSGDSFTKLNLDYAHIQSVGQPFLIFRLSGQVATNPLVVGEQFSLGGPDSVRGYAQSELLGDAGYAASAELRLPLPEADSPFQLAAFVDHGTEWLYQPQVGEFSHQSLTGAGLGFRWALGEKTNVRFDLGFPLAPTVNSTNNNPMLYGQFETRF